LLKSDLASQIFRNNYLDFYLKTETATVKSITLLKLNHPIQAVQEFSDVSSYFKTKYS